ncbi:hypothetical protein [Vibrio phage Va-ZX-1]
MAVAAAGGAAAASSTAATTAAAVTAAVSIASAAYSMYAANQNAKAQEEAAERRNKQLVETTIANYDELSEQELEAQQASLEDSLSMQKDYLKEKGRINVMAAYSGVGGMSVASQLQDLERTKFSNFNIIQQNQQAEYDNIADQAESMRYGAMGSMDVRPISRPSAVAGLLNIGSAALQGYSGYQQAKSEVAPAEPALKSGV